MRITSQFDSGNIEVVDATDPDNVQLAIRKDAQSEHAQWFHFRASGVRDIPLTLRIINAQSCSYPKAWEGSRAVVSTDRKTWTRADTKVVNGELQIRHTSSSDAVYFAYFAPYSYDRHQDFVAEMAGCAGVAHDVLGVTLDGRDMDRLQVGTGPTVLWVIGRQHPGETMASWWMEGFLRRLTDAADPIARALRERARLHIVPHMNPDGGFRGHLRTNALGVNLNRVWDAPTMSESPEVKLVRDAMDQSGVDLGLDVHGDEELPYNFIAGPDGIPSFSPALQAKLDAFLALYERANPDFQSVHGYPVAAPGQANMSMFTNQVAERYGALAMTLEMPFKDNANAPDAVFGWSPERCARLGASTLHPLLEILPNLQ